MTRKKRNLLFVGLIAILGIVFLCMMKFGKYWQEQKSIDLGNKIKESWKPTSLVSLTNLQEVAASIESIMARGTNTHLISDRQMKALKKQIQNCLETYSQGDFNKFVEFRMPCGKGVNTVFNQEELKRYKNFLPAAAEVARNFAENPSAIPEEYHKEIQRYSLSTSMNVWKYMWLVGSLSRYKASGGKLYCNDCWTDISPDQSWVTISELPLSALYFAKQAGTFGIGNSPPDINLSPPKGRNESTPKMYAAVRLHVNTNRKIGSHPFFIIFALTTKPECWIPVAFVSAYHQGTNYIF